MTAYPEAKDIYWNLGWPGVLPLKHATKAPLPVGFTGKGGRFPQYNDLVMWEQMYPDGNICLRLPDEIAIGNGVWCIIGIDIDAYDGKTGATTLAEAEKRWGPMPPTYRATSRTDGISGIRLYRVPVGTKLRGVLKFPELNIGDIEIIQFHHRYVVCWPSIHNKTGLMYLWYDEAAGLAVMDTPPAPHDLPVLPQAWLEGLRIDAPRNGFPTRAEKNTTTPKRETGILNVTDAMTEGRASVKVAMRLAEALTDLAQGVSRHDTMCQHVLGLLRFGRDGEPGVEVALRALCCCFVGAVASDREGGEPVADAEFLRMITNAEQILAAEPPHEPFVWPGPKRPRWGAGGRV